MDLLTQASNLRAIYQDMESYKDLRPNDQNFFDNLFVLLLVYDTKIFSNKYLSQRFNMPISTIEKRIKRLVRAKLITRNSKTDFENGKWITSERSLDLDPITFSFAKVKDQEQRILTARLAAANKELDPMLEAYKATQKKEEPAEPPPPQSYKVEVRFN